MDTASRFVDGVDVSSEKLSLELWKRLVWCLGMSWPVIGRRCHPLFPGVLFRGAMHLTLSRRLGAPAGIDLRSTSFVNYGTSNKGTSISPLSSVVALVAAHPSCQAYPIPQ